MLLNGSAFTLPAGAAALIAAGAFTLTDTTSNGGATSIGYSYDPSAANLDFLRATDTLTITYAVKVNDGTADSATQDVTFTISGTADQFSLQHVFTKTGNADAREGIFAHLYPNTRICHRRHGDGHTECRSRRFARDLPVRYRADRNRDWSIGGSPGNANGASETLQTYSSPSLSVNAARYADGSLLVSGEFSNQVADNSTATITFDYWL